MRNCERVEQPNAPPFLRRYDGIFMAQCGVKISSHRRSDNTIIIEIKLVVDPVAYL